MKEHLRKAFDLGLEAFELTRKKAEKVAKDMQNKGSISKKEAKEFVDEVVAKADKARVELKAHVETEVKKVLKNSIINLKKHLDEVEKAVDKPKKKRTVKKKPVKKKVVKKNPVKKKVVKKKKR